MAMTDKHVVVIAGPTGSGESTITNEIAKRYPNRVKRIVTATTRQKRAGEVDGVDYYFFTAERFLAEKASGNILESTYIENRDTYYGTYAPDFIGKIDAGNIVIMNPDIVGARYYKEHYSATTIFILPGAMDELGGRLRHRNPEMSERDILIRLENAKHEVEHEQLFYDYVVTNENGKIDEAVARVVEIMSTEGYNLVI
jgi:guanylate kinase